MVFETLDKFPTNINLPKLDDDSRFLNSCCLVMPARSVGRSVDEVEIGSHHLSFDTVGRRGLASL